MQNKNHKMKILINCFLLISLMLSGCNKNDNPDILPPCDSIILNTYSKANGKIVELNVQDTGSVYVITVSKWDMLLYKNRPIHEWDSILVPYPELPVEYREDNLRVLFSGEKNSCCDLLTLPAADGSFGCKLEMDSIEKKQESLFSGFVEGYITGSFRCFEIKNEHGTEDLTEPGFMIILEDNTDSLYTFTLPPKLVDFPPDTINRYYDSYTCGPVFLPDSLQREYKIRFRYRTPEEFEKVQWYCGICFYIGPTFNWEEYDQVIIREVTRVIN